jgi:sugar-specific transcriptional regulator TrmB
MKTLNTNLLAWLMDSGLDEQRAKLYLITLSKGRATAAELAKELKVNRTAVYDNLRVLEVGGYVTVIHEGKRKVYVPLHPNDLYRTHQAKQKHLKELMPDFLSAYAKDTAAATVQMFEGPRAAREIYEDIISVTKEEYVYLSPPELTHRMVDETEMKKWVERRVKKGIKSRSLRVRGKDVPKIKEYNEEDPYLRKIKYLPAYVDLKSSLYIYEKNVGVISTAHEGVAFIIHSPDLAFSMKQIFEFLWSVGMRD